MPTRNRKSEKGVSLLFAMLALLLLTAIAAGMMFMSSTEATISRGRRSFVRVIFTSTVHPTEKYRPHPCTLLNKAFPD